VWIAGASQRGPWLRRSRQAPRFDGRAGTWVGWNPELEEKEETLKDLKFASYVAHSNLVDRAAVRLLRLALNGLFLLQRKAVVLSSWWRGDVTDEGRDIVTVYKVPFSKAQLARLTQEERALVVLLGNAANQLAVFWKLVYFCTNDVGDENDTAQQLVQGGQTQILVRQTVGIAYEAWMVIQTRFLQKPLGREYQSLLSPEGIAALDSLKKYFGSKNPIYAIRNHFAFHHPESVDVENDFQNAMSDPDLDPEWNWYLTEQSINTFYFLSDLVIAQGMARAAGFTDIADGHRRVMKDLNEVFAWLGTFVQAYFYAALAKYNASLEAKVCSKIKAAASDSVCIPFYIFEPSHGAYPQSSPSRS
jgi:hypothetical protein